LIFGRPDGTRKKAHTTIPRVKNPGLNFGRPSGTKLNASVLIPDQKYRKSSLPTAANERSCLENQYSGPRCFSELGWLILLKCALVPITFLKRWVKTCIENIKKPERKYSGY